MASSFPTVLPTPATTFSGGLLAVVPATGFTPPRLLLVPAGIRLPTGVHAVVGDASRLVVAATGRSVVGCRGQCTTAPRYVLFAFPVCYSRFGVFQPAAHPLMIIVRCFACFLLLQDGDGARRANVACAALAEAEVCMCLAS